jgi:ribosomal protein S18 acetylase RimI-like enzyme
MIALRTLITFRPEEVERYVPGYISPEKYIVTRAETPDAAEVLFTLRRVTLDPPYIKRFPPEPELYPRYSEIIQAGTSLGAFDGDQLVGVAIAEIQEWNETLWIWEFGVLESHRRQGIGLRMMDELAQRARGWGARIMLVETQNTNGPAIRFYRRAGFTFDALDLTYYSNNDTLEDEIALFMKRKITAST